MAQVRTRRLESEGPARGPLLRSGRAAFGALRLRFRALGCLDDERHRKCCLPDNAEQPSIGVSVESAVFTEWRDDDYFSDQ